MPPRENPHAAWERNFIAQMAHLREQRGMTQNELARTLKAYGLPFHQQTVQRIESGDRPVRLDEAFLIAKVLEVDLASMTATLGDAQRELLYVVDWVCREGASAAQGFGEMLGDWLERVDNFGVELSARLEKGGRLDTITLCGLAFGSKILSADSAALCAYNELMMLSGEAAHGREDDAEGAFLYATTLDQMKTWLDRYACPELDALLVLTGAELYAMLSDATIAEAWDNLAPPGSAGDA